MPLEMNGALSNLLIRKIPSTMPRGVHHHNFAPGRKFFFQSKSLANRGTAGIILRRFWVNKMQRSRFLALRWRFILSPPRHFQNNGGEWTGPKQAWVAELREGLQRENELSSRPYCYLLGSGCPGSCDDPG